MEKLIIYFLLSISFTWSTFAQADSVGGPAGGDVSVQFTGTCGYDAKNNGSRRVRVHLGPFSRLLNPGEQFRFVGAGGCFRGYVGETKAVYE
jgi:hypothetical protein